MLKRIPPTLSAVYSKNGNVSWPNAIRVKKLISLISWLVCVKL